jgi:hypothetical protein
VKKEDFVYYGVIALVAAVVLVQCGSDTGPSYYPDDCVVTYYSTGPSCE